MRFQRTRSVNRLLIEDISVSRRHVEQKSGWTYRLRPRYKNGTFINDIPTKSGSSIMATIKSELVFFFFLLDGVRGGRRTKFS